MAVAEISVLFPPDGDEAAALLDRCLGVGIVAEEKLFAEGVGGKPHVLAARREEELVGVAVTSGTWLRLLAVDPSARGTGIGSLLLDASLAHLRSGGHERARLAAEPGNYLAPGIDVDDEATIAWFEKRGFVRGVINTNLVIDVATNDRVTSDHLAQLIARSEERGYGISRATGADAAELLSLATSYGHAWGIEVERALKGAAGAVHIARSMNGGKIAAFAAHDGNNQGLGWFGPAATLEAHRGRGLGEAVLIACLLDVRAAGHEVCNIAWIGPREFYRRAAGILGERSFVSLDKDL